MSGICEKLWKYPSHPEEGTRPGIPATALCGSSSSASGAAGTAAARGASQLVTSAVVKRAHANEVKSSAYTANESRPCSIVAVSMGTRSRESNESHQCVGRYGWITANCGTVSATSLATTMIATAAIAPIECSVSVEIASPIAPRAAIAAATYKVTNSSRTSPAASGTVVPDSSVTGPTGNRATPVSSAAAVTTNVAARPKVTIAAYLAASSRVRPAGTASR